jgi:hypothetical protein
MAPEHLENAIQFWLASPGKFIIGIESLKERQ